MLIGRRLVKSWGHGKMIALEKLSPTEPMAEGLYEVFEFDGELNYLRIGEPHKACQGRSVGEVFETPEAWMTSNEVAQLTNKNPLDR